MSSHEERSPQRPVVLTIAGADSSAGAGIGIDLKVFSALGTYGTFVITAVTAQNTVGVRSVHPVPGASITAQLQAIFEDLPVAAIKTGMLGSRESVEAIASFFDSVTDLPPLIVDPVWISESGVTLLHDDAWTALTERILPHAELVTPNRQEAARLLGQSDLSFDDLGSAAERILEFGGNSILIKGGHFEGDESVDFMASRTKSCFLRSRRRNLGPVHGTGCALSAAIAAERAKGRTLDSSIGTAREHLLSWLDHSNQIGKGARILDPKPLVGETP